MLNISNNLLAINADNHLNTSVSRKVKSTEKLSSGYRINRAADDAAGLAISEEMRRQIRGLNQGTKNAQDGVSWVQTGDGALNETHDILHRMQELAVKAMNGTNTETDRLALEMEFEQLQNELDKIGQSTKFNDMPIFDKHETPYYQIEGNVNWDPHLIHVVSAGDNDLTFKYKLEENGPQKELTVTVPPGEYTTQELVDEIESALGDREADGEKLVLEYAPTGCCNATVESGEAIDEVTGGLSYLLHKVYKGGGFGALIGTTFFPKETSKLEVVDGKNDYMSFTIEDLSGNKVTKEIDLPGGRYTRQDLVNILNGQLQGTTVVATAHGSGIKLQSDEAIVTGFKGNMFRIDGKDYTSVFYDNVKYGGIVQTAAYFNGGGVLPTNQKDEEHKYYVIDSTNNTLTLQPNDMENPISLTIDAGKYTAEAMRDKLNELFTANGMKLIASVSNSGGFKGLTIVSEVKGPDSKVNIDDSSSAYDTLFETRKYNSYQTSARMVNETTADSDGWWKGSKDLSGLGTTPLEITAGTNDSFKISINGTTSTITLTSGKSYYSAQEIADEINAQLNGPSAAMAYKGKVTASVSGNKILLEGADGEKVNTIRVSANGNNQGYKDIFVGYSSSSYSQTASGTGQVTLNTPFNGTINPSDSSITINVDGVNQTVQLPTGNVTQDQIKDAIENAIKPQIVTSPNVFKTVNVTGKTTNNHFSSTASGRLNPIRWSDSAQGTSDSIEGKVDFTNSEPAELTLGPALKSSMPIDSTNNEIVLTLNGRTETIDLGVGNTYTPSTLQAALQSKIDYMFGTGMGGAIVQLEGNKLKLVSRLPAGEDGKDTTISCSTDTSSFLRDLNSTKAPAVWTSGKPLASSITINDGDTFTFKYTENGTPQDITLTLKGGTYSPSSILTEINTQLAKTGTGITASSKSGKLALTSGKEGNVSIGYNTATGGTSVEALFGPMLENKPADVVVPLKTEESIEITPDSNQFTIRVNGQDKTVTLDEGTYDRSGFKEMLNRKLAGTGVEAYLSGDKLGYRTTAEGSSASIRMDYYGGGSSMKSIYGESTKEISGVKVEFTSDNKVVLKTTNPGSKISVSSSSGGPFQKPVGSPPTPINPTWTDGFHSTTHSYIDGVSLDGNVTINEWNDTLKFNFIENGTSSSVNIDVPDKDAYTYTELQTTLQDLVDKQVGADKITVTVDANGVRLEMVKPGSDYRFASPSGDFYDKVMGKCTERIDTVAATGEDGTQTIDPAYTVGRKDVKNEISDIRMGNSDEFSFDFTIGGKVHKINVKLTPGKYGGEDLKNHLQEKINEQLEQLGFEKNLIEVGIGGVPSGVYGANDENALNLSLSKTVKAPSEGECIIDGVSGNAAFEIFYYTEGKLIPAYIVGTKDISNGVSIGPDDKELSMKVDGTEYTIPIPEGEYTTEEILKVVNDGLTAKGAPLVATMDSNGAMKISHKKMGVHTINDISGEAKDNVFFAENGDKVVKPGRIIQLSSKRDDDILLPGYIFNTTHLGINSVCISKPKYAAKAMERLETALERISDMRSGFGSMQNRLEHAINNNENKSENTQSAESLIRDTDMAAEMVRYSNLNILEQSGQSILAQANQMKEGILALLR